MTKVFAYTELSSVLREKPRTLGRGGIARRRKPTLFSLPPYSVRYRVLYSTLSQADLRRDSPDVKPVENV